MEPPPKKDPTKKYECVEIIWPYAKLTAGEVDRQCAVQDEQT